MARKPAYTISLNLPHIACVKQNDFFEKWISCHLTDIAL